MLSFHDDGVTVIYDGDNDADDDADRQGDKGGGNDKVITVLTSGPHLLASTHPV